MKRLDPKRYENVDVSQQLEVNVTGESTSQVHEVETDTDAAADDDTGSSPGSGNSPATAIDVD